MQTPDEYIHTLLMESAIAHTVPARGSDLQSSILTLLFSGKFRKKSVTPTCREHTEKAVATCIEANKPIQILFPMGGYKYHEFPSAPFPDWAEFFGISHILSYLAPIAKIYPPGVRLTFYIHKLLMEVHNNMKPEGIASYITGFSQILDMFRTYLPTNISIAIQTDEDCYPREIYRQTLESYWEEAKNEYASWTDAKREQYRIAGLANIIWDGNEDWTTLNTQEREQKVVNGSLYEIIANHLLPKLWTDVLTAERVFVFTKSSPLFIGIGSTKNSLAKYWMGYGILESDDLGYYPRVLTLSQYTKISAESYTDAPISGIPGVNFTSLHVYPKRFFFERS